jgi:hypothetical protein
VRVPVVLSFNGPPCFIKFSNTAVFPNLAIPLFPFIHSPRRFYVLACAWWTLFITLATSTARFRSPQSRRWSSGLESVAHIVLGSTSFRVPLLPPSVYKICVGFRPKQEIGETVNVKIDNCTDPTGAKVDTIYTVIALRYTIDCPLINPNPQICLWTFFCP